MQQRKTYTPDQIQALWKELDDVPQNQAFERNKIAAAEKLLINLRAQVDQFDKDVFTPESDHLKVLRARSYQLEYPAQIAQLEARLHEYKANLKNFKSQLAAAKIELEGTSARIRQLHTGMRLCNDRRALEELGVKLAGLQQHVAIHQVNMGAAWSELQQQNQLIAQDQAALSNVSASLAQIRERKRQEQERQERMAREAAERAEQERLARDAVQQQSGMASSQQPSGGMTSSMSNSGQGGVMSSSMQSGGMHSSMQNSRGGVISSQQVTNDAEEQQLQQQIDALRGSINQHESAKHQLQQQYALHEADYRTKSEEMSRLRGVAASLEKAIKDDAASLINVVIPESYQDMQTEYSNQNSASRTQTKLVAELQGKVDANQRAVYEVRQQLSRLQQALSDAGPTIAALRRLYPEVADTEAAGDAQLTLSQKKGKIFREIEEESSVSVITKKRDEQEGQFTLVRNELVWLRSAVSQQENVIQSAKQAIARLGQRQQDLQQNHFLMSYRDEPQVLVNALYNRVRTTLTSFAQRNDLHAQSPLVRAWLSTLQGKMDFILSLQYRNKSEIERAQILYIELSGLVQRAIAQTVLGGDRSFALQLDDLLSPDIIEKNYALNRYEALRGRHPQELQELTEQDVARIDQINFDHATAELRKRLATLPQDANSVLKKYYRDVDALLKNTEQRLAVARTKNQNFDYVLNTNILTTAGDLLFRPHDGVLRNKLIVLGGNIKEGEQSLWKKVLGIIGAIIGGALLITGGLGLQGILPGVSLYASIPMVAGGATLFAGGVALAVNGRRKGFCKTLDRMDDRITQVVNDRDAAQTLEQVSSSYALNQNVMFQQPSAPVWDEISEDARPSAPPMNL